MSFPFATPSGNLCLKYISLTIKGHANDDAVLCTRDKTFTMRSVVLSNTILIVSPIPDGPTSNLIDDTVVIRDQLNEVIELVSIVPKLHKLSAIIRDRQYDEGEDDNNIQEDDKVTHYPQHLKG